MKKIAILILSILIAGLFVACNQDITVDAQTYANMEVGTFVLNGQNYATLQEAVNAKLGKSAKALGDNDGVIYLTRNASGPGAVINSAVTGGVTIDFAGYTYSFTNVTGLQGGEAPKPESFGLAVTNGAQVTLKGMEKIDLNDKSTSALTMVYIEGAETKLSIESAPKMVVEPEQYVFWAANGATLTIGGETQVGGGVAATAESSVKTTETAKLEKTTLKAEKSTIIFNSTVTPTIQTLQVSDEANLVVAGAAPEVTKNDSDANASYTIINTTDDTVTIPDTTGEAISVPTNQEVAVEDGKTQTAEDIDGVAAIEYVIYETLDGADGAVAGAKSGDTILLLKDVDFNSSSLVIPKDKNVVLDLNGHKIESTGWVVTNLGTLKIVDNTKEKKGIIQSTKGCGVEGSGSASVTTIESGNVLAQEAAFMLFYGASGTINGGTFTTVDNFVVGTNGTAGQGKNTIVINGGTFNGNITSSGYVACGIYAPNDDSITVNGGTFTVTNGAGIVARAGNVTVTGGSFTCTGDTTGKVGDSKVVVPCSAIVYDSSSNYPGRTDESKITVSDGKFTSADDDGVVVFVDAGDTNERIVLTGGEYSSDPSMFVAEGYEAVAQGTDSQIWKVSAKEAVAKIGDKTFFSLEAAVDAAKDGDTIILLKDYSCGTVDDNRVEFDYDKSIAIDLNSKTLTACFLVRNGAISVDNGTIKGADGNETVFRIIGSGDTQKAKDSIVVTIGEDAVLTGNYTVMIRENDTGATKNNAYGVTLNINGSVSGNNPLWVMGNIKEGNSVININSSAVLTVTDETENDIDDRGTCIANQGYVSTTIYDGAQLTGFESAIEARSGIVNIKGGTFTATSEPASSDFNNNGTTTVGTVIAFAPYGNSDLTVKIEGGTFTGYTAAYLSDPNGTGDSKVNTFITSGGVFYGSNSAVGHAGDLYTFMSNDSGITGGTFSSDPSYYVAPGYGVVYDDATKTYTVKELWTKGLTAYTTGENLNIGTAEELAKFALSVNSGVSYAGKTITLTASIDLSGKVWVPILFWNDTANRNAKLIFDGNGKTVSNVECFIGKPNDGDDYVSGLFGNAPSGGTIKKLTVDKANVAGYHFVGGITAHGLCVNIEDCTVTNSSIISMPRYVSASSKYDDGDKVGGIVGYYSAETNEAGPIYVINGCSVSGCVIKGYRDIGGVAGMCNANDTADKKAEVKNNSVTNVSITSDWTHNYKSFDSQVKANTKEVIGRLAERIEVADNTTLSVSINYNIPN